MRTRKENGTIKLWLSASDTDNWATRDGAHWPCSILAGNAIFAEFDRAGDLIDYRGPADVPADEFTAITDDFLGEEN